MTHNKQQENILDPDYRKSKYAQWIRENPELYQKTLQLQDDLHKAGFAWHNPFADECNADFSCCIPQPSEQREGEESFYCGKNEGYDYDRCLQQCSYCFSQQRETEKQKVIKYPLYNDDGSISMHKLPIEQQAKEESNYEWSKDLLHTIQSLIEKNNRQTAAAKIVSAIQDELSQANNKIQKLQDSLKTWEDGAIKNLKRIESLGKRAFERQSQLNSSEVEIANKAWDAAVDSRIKLNDQDWPKAKSEYLSSLSSDKKEKI